jgi:hypothetical protein
MAISTEKETASFDSQRRWTMTISSRLKKLEALPVNRHAFMDRMTEISSDQAEEIYDQVMNGPSPPLFARTRYGTVPFQDLSEEEIARIYSQYANGNLEIITEKEI